MGVRPLKHRTGQNEVKYTLWSGAFLLGTHVWLEPPEEPLHQSPEFCGSLCSSVTENIAHTRPCPRAQSGDQHKSLLP